MERLLTMLKVHAQSTCWLVCAKPRSNSVVSPEKPLTESMLHPASYLRKVDPSCRVTCSMMLMLGVESRYWDCE